MSIQVVRERPGWSTTGLPVLPLLLAGMGSPLLGVPFGSALARSAPAVGPLIVLASLALGFASFVGLWGLFVVQPNQARVLQLFGSYRGTVRETGLRWTNPLFSKRAISVRVRNFESEKLKVNDHDGNPVEIAAVVVWRVTDSAEAMFHVDDYEHFVAVQSEAALRNLATLYPYDAHALDAVSLRSHPLEVSEKLRLEVEARLAQAGVHVLEARISHLAYAPEIAGAMLQRQQASAIVAAREKIVEGAVGMVDMALEQLARRELVTLDEDARGALVSNLLVVLCADSPAQPVVQTGAVRRSRGPAGPAAIGRTAA